MKIIIRRFPNDVKAWWNIEGSYTQKEAERALNLAKEVVDFVKEKITP